MAVIDYVILAVVLISALVSFARGFLREVLSLAAWTIAIVCAFNFAPDAAPYFGKWLADTTLQYWAAVVAVFLATLLVCGIVNWLISQLFNEFGTSGTDRSLGILLGAARGVVVVALMLLGARVISLPVDSWGSEAKLYPQVSEFSEWLWSIGSNMAGDWGSQVGPQAELPNPAPENAAVSDTTSNSSDVNLASETDTPLPESDGTPVESPAGSLEQPAN